MTKVDYGNILDVEYGINPQQQQGQLERLIAEWREVPEQPGQQQQQQAQPQLYANRVQRPLITYQQR